MALPVFPHLVSFGIEPDFRLRLSFSDGTEGVVSLQPWLDLPVFAPVRSPERFAQVQLGSGGRTIFWNEQLDICADSLYLEVKNYSALGLSALIDACCSSEGIIFC